jgi:hypothetical protein
MANVLIVDLLEASAYLVRSLLRGRGHAASIAVSTAEAHAKLETGLFDTLVADLSDANAETLAIVNYANDLLPGLPVVGLVRPETEGGITGVDLFGKFSRPIRGADVNKAVDRAIQHALGLGTRRKTPRIEVDFPLTVEWEGSKLTARVSDISPRGFAIDAGSDAADLTAAPKLELLMGGGRINARMQPQKHPGFSVTGRVAFVDRGRKSGGRMIGVVFENIEAGGSEYLNALFAVPAEAGAQPAAQAA